MNSSSNTKLSRRQYRSRGILSTQRLFPVIAVVTLLYGNSTACKERQPLPDTGTDVSEEVFLLHCFPLHTPDQLALATLFLGRATKSYQALQESSIPADYDGQKVLSVLNIAIAASKFLAYRYDFPDPSSFPDEDHGRLERSFQSLMGHILMFNSNLNRAAVPASVREKWASSEWYDVVAQTSLGELAEWQPLELSYRDRLSAVIKTDTQELVSITIQRGIAVIKANATLVGGNGNLSAEARDARNQKLKWLGEEFDRKFLLPRWRSKLSSAEKTDIKTAVTLAERKSFSSAMRFAIALSNYSADLMSLKRIKPCEGGLTPQLVLALENYKQRVAEIDEVSSVYLGTMDQSQKVDQMMKALDWLNWFGPGAL
jgi:hypothetical protein